VLLSVFNNVNILHVKTPYLMKKSLLVLLTIFTSFAAWSQPNTYWSEDFANGPKGWTVQTSLCGTFTGGLTGKWTLSSATFDGDPVTGLAAEFIVSTGAIYSAKMWVNGEENLVQSRYTLAGDVFQSSLTGVALTLGAPAFTGTVTETTWFTSLNVDQSVLDSWGSTVLGLGNPTAVAAANALTITSADGLTVLNYTKTSDCGDLWLFHHRGNVGAAFTAADNLAIQSPTVTNGAMVINADFYSTGGTVAPMQPYPQYIAELISPVLDFSNVTDAVSLRFNQLVRILNVPAGAPEDEEGNALRTAISISLDGGNTWETAQNANPGLQPATGANPIPALNNVREIPLPGLQGQPNVRIKFTWAADFYYWVLDDIAIIDRVPYDMKVNRNFFAILPNAVTPVSQTEPVSFLADIQNDGGRTATNVELNLTIKKSGSGEVIYDDTNEYGDITADSLAENVFFEESLDPSALTVGDYIGNYVVSHDSLDNVPGNNTIGWRFAVSDTTFAKEFGSTRNVAPSGEDSYMLGNCFHTPNGDGWFARYISFGVSNASQLTGRSVSTYIFKWDGDTDGNGRANPEEYGQGPLLFNSYTFDGTESNQIITIPIDLDGNTLPLEDDAYYLLMVHYVTDDAQRCFMLAGDTLNYSAMNFISDSLQQSRYATMVGLGQDIAPEFFTAGFGFDLQALVRMHIGNNPNLDGPAIVGVNEAIVKETFAKVFPNPAAESFNVQLELDRASDVRVTISDRTGRTLHVRQLENLQNETLTFDATNLPAGQYYVRISTDMGTNVKPLVIGK
jgi:hypothetical protein